MIRRGISYEDVADAAENIRAQGEVPTIERIRTELGGTGSNTTISKYLNEWRQFAVGEHISAPIDPVQTAVKRVWQQLREETDLEINKIREESSLLIQEAQAKEQQAKLNWQELKEQLSIAEEKLNAIQADKEELALVFKRKQEEHALLLERHKGLEERYADFQRITVSHQEDMAQAHKNEISHILEKVKLQEESHQKILTEMKNYQEDQRHLFISERDSLKTQNQKMRNELDKTQINLKEKSEELAKLKAEYNAVVKERDKFLEQIPLQDKYWGLIEKNNQITNSIWLEVKNIPKIDMALTSMSFLNQASSSISNSLQEFSSKTRSFLGTISKNPLMDETNK